MVAITHHLPASVQHLQLFFLILPSQICVHTTEIIQHYIFFHYKFLSWKFITTIYLTNVFYEFSLDVKHFKCVKVYNEIITLQVYNIFRHSGYNLRKHFQNRDLLRKLPKVSEIYWKDEGTVKQNIR